MKDPSSSFGPDYFERLYAASADPWNFTSSDYEHQKYRATLDALPRRHFGTAFDVGCSIGILTRYLAPICDAVLAVDIAEAPLVQARQHCVDLNHVQFRRMTIPTEWPSESFDLILFSEVLYYLDGSDIGFTAQRVLKSLLPYGVVLLVHWLGETDYPSGGDEAVDRFITAIADEIKPIGQYRQPRYRIDVLARDHSRLADRAKSTEP